MRRHNINPNLLHHLNYPYLVEDSTHRHQRDHNQRLNQGLSYLLSSKILLAAYAAAHIIDVIEKRYVF